MAVRPTDPEALQLFQLIGAPLLAVIQAEAQAAQVSGDFIKRVGFEEAPSRGGPRAAPAPAPSPPPASTATPAPRPGASPASPGVSAPDAKPADVEPKWLQDGGDFGQLRVAEFRVDRYAVDGAAIPHVVRVPVLSLFPIPLLQVKHADFEFDIHVLSRVPLSPEAEIPPGAAALRAGAPKDAKGSEQDEQKNPDGTAERTELSPDYLAKQRVELKGFLAGSRGGDKGGVDASIKVKVRMEQSDLPAGLIHLMKVMGDSVSVTPLALIEQAKARETQGNT